MNHDPRSTTIQNVPTHFPPHTLQTEPAALNQSVPKRPWSFSQLTNLSGTPVCWSLLARLTEQSFVVLWQETSRFPTSCPAQHLFQTVKLLTVPQTHNAVINPHGWDEEGKTIHLLTELRPWAKMGFHPILANDFCWILMLLRWLLFDWGSLTGSQFELGSPYGILFLHYHKW